MQSYQEVQRQAGAQVGRFRPLGAMDMRGGLDLRGGDRLFLHTAVPPDASLVVQWFVRIEKEDEWLHIPYKPDVNSHIEADYWTGALTTSFTVGRSSYSIDFSSMTQKNLSTNTDRPVSRCLKMIPNSTPPTMDRKLGWTVIHSDSCHAPEGGGASSGQAKRSRGANPNLRSTVNSNGPLSAQ